jgi:hypothetical protein
MVVVHQDGIQPAVPLPALSEDFDSVCAGAQERDEKLWLEVGMPSRGCVFTVAATTYTPGQANMANLHHVFSTVSNSLATKA